ncbi:hypothetical protein SAMN05660297_03204 [Natronincola peptidivorans]|uniref:Uncharacterized protein n=1 Tax=Natronincola peptidivorans TaxID=426128 RepID=A0A1I0GIZ3_9FIRM|nr:hypothetical protein [Natronincola peptidivorans]SET70314.1 hypothetical protein SAMN05660297_03204 [Natronincola peptidivorans]
MSKDCPQPKQECPQLPGTIVRISIPAGAVINLANLIEITSPSGICIIVRLPILAGTAGIGSIYSNIVKAIESAGGKIEFVQE